MQGSINLTAVESNSGSSSLELLDGPVDFFEEELASSVLLDEDFALLLDEFALPDELLPLAELFVLPGSSDSWLIQTHSSYSTLYSQASVASSGSKYAVLPSIFFEHGVFAKSFDEEKV